MIGCFSYWCFRRQIYPTLDWWWITKWKNGGPPNENFFENRSPVSTQWTFLEVLFVSILTTSCRNGRGGDRCCRISLGGYPFVQSRGNWFLLVMLYSILRNSKRSNWQMRRMTISPSSWRKSRRVGFSWSLFCHFIQANRECSLPCKRSTSILRDWRTLFRLTRFSNNSVTKVSSLRVLNYQVLIHSDCLSSEALEAMLDMPLKEPAVLNREISQYDLARLILRISALIFFSF